MPNYIVLRLVPDSPIAPGPTPPIPPGPMFTSYLANLTVKVYDISYDNPSGQAAPATLAVTLPSPSESLSKVTLNGNFGPVSPGDPILVLGVGTGYDGVFVCATTNATTTTPATSLTYVAGSGPFTLTPALGTVQPHVIGIAQYNAPTKVWPLPPYYTYPAGTCIAQHFDSFSGDLLSVATAIIPVPAGIPEYVSPSILIEFDRTGFPPVLDPHVYYEATLLNGAAPTPDLYKGILSSSVSAYVTLPAPPVSTASAPLQIPTNGNPPNFGDLLAAVTAVLTRDPSPAPTAAMIAGLTVDQCRNIAYEIVYGPQPPLPGPPESLEDMYTFPPNDGTPSNSNEQARSGFQGGLTSYYAQRDASAEHLTNFVFSLSAALSCELQSQGATSAILDFPVNPNGSASTTNATVTEAEVILTGAPGMIDIPAKYFYALTARMPAQIAANQRYKSAIGADVQQNLTQLTDAVDAGWIDAPMAATMNPAQAALALGALAVPASSTVPQCPIASIAPIWTDWLAYPPFANWKAYQPGDEMTGFWPAEATSQPGPFLDLVLCVLTQAYVDTSSGNTLASEIKASLLVAGSLISTVGDLSQALPSDWKKFFQTPIQVNLLPPFTQPGNPAARVAAFIRYFQSFFGVQPLALPTFSGTGTAPPGLNLPAFDAIAQTIAAYSGFAFGSPLVLTTLEAAAKVVVPDDPQARAWAVQAIWTMNDLFILVKPVAPASLQFSVMEALFARGFTSIEDVLDLPQDDFQQALAGTVAYDFAKPIYDNAGTPHTFPPPGTQEFTPINPGSLTDCIPPLYLSPLGPIAYLHEMLKVSENSTCDDPFAPPEVDRTPTGTVVHPNLAGMIDQRRGPIDTTLLVTRANLETRLPLIDIVNECLEYAASARPPIRRGTVYNTSEDALAGHQLCVEECCPEEEKPEAKRGGAACHDPAILFTALPEYSTPGTPFPSGARFKYPGLSNADVEPAVYNILKADFSSCCLPYSQALDVSRTYVEHFRSCRFELMRTFRKCITEYVLDPKNPPPGFRPYQWRYPVRIDIAIEYLGITPEEYTLVFGGVWPDPCKIPDTCEIPGTVPKPQTLPARQLYGFSLEDQSWTKIVVQLPEFLKRTCLTHCEFLDLWKSGFVTFSNGGNPAGAFPDCEPCCLDKLHLAFLEIPGQVTSFETSLYKLAVFIRLWRKLKGLCGGGYSFEQLTDICQVLPLLNGNAINPDFIRQLAAFQMLRDQLRLPLTDEHANVAPGATGADRTHLLSLWVGKGHQWDWALERFMEGIAHYAACRFKCEGCGPELLKQIAGNLDCLSVLAGFDPATASATWHAAPAHTLRFAEILAKICASKFSIGEILFLFTADDRLCGKDEHDHDHEHDHEHEHEHEHEREHEKKHSPWQLRRKLLERHVPKEETEDWTWTRLESALQHEFRCAGELPSLQRQQAMFDCWERVFDYDCVRKELGERSECHLRFFQDQTAPVYALTIDDLDDDRWMVRIGHADRWIESLSRCFRVKDIDQARPDLWASDDPAALVAGETVTGNANLSGFLGDGCLETGAPRLYDDLKKLNDGLRERGRCALIAYLCGVKGIVSTPKELSDLLLLDVETGLCEKASRVEEAITAVQTFIQRSRIGLEVGWKITPQFAHMWDSRFSSYHVWQACKRRELYKENWIDWHELEKAKKIESFRFMDEELRRVTLTIAAPGGVDYWPEHRPPAPGLCLLQDREPATMQLLPAPREGLGLLATPERDGRPSWITTGPVPAIPPAAPGTMPSAPVKLPLWMECAIKLGTRFVRVAAAGYPPASTPFEPWKSSNTAGTPVGTKEESCVECCVECGCRHPAHVDEYYFWLVDGRHFDPRSQPIYNTFDAQQNSYYDPSVQDSTPWHDPTQLPNLLEWPSDPMVRLAWCCVHNEEFRQPRISVHGIDVKAATAPELSFQGRFGDSLYFQVTNLAATSGFRYDLAVDEAHVVDDPTAPTTPLPSPLSPLTVYPYFAYFQPGARLFPWSPYSPAIAVANALRAHCRFEAALKWYDLYYDPLARDNTWTRCVQEDPSSKGSAAGVVAPAKLEVPASPAAVLATPAVPGTPEAPITPLVPIVPAGQATVTTCCDSTDVSCHVARERSVLLHYLETLVEWGDALMRRDSPEQFQQARVIFDSARRIMGSPPQKVLNSAAVNSTLATVANFVPLMAPINPRLMMLYDRLDDRMALIHHCLDKRRLRQASERHDAQYWGNDPVRDGWRSDLCHCCEEGDCHPHSPYRFTFLIQKAKELANQTRELGGALLAAFEKGDAEYLASVRAVHEHELLMLGRKIREGEWRDADFQVQALQKTKESDQASRRYYANLIANGLISNETGYVNQTGVALDYRIAGNASEAIGQLMVVIPDAWLSALGPVAQIPVGTKLAGLFAAIARVLNALADNASTTASLDLTEAGWDRRLQDWVHQVEILDIQIEQVELQILGSERRRDDSLGTVNNQQRQIEQSTELMNFLRDKFTNHAVYLFLQKNTADLHYQMYELALSAAREAERAFHFERGHVARKFVSCEGWDNLHEGLLAGERLQLSLAQMEKEYCDRNRREYELTKHISFRLQFPLEFLRLKLTGRCEIELPEWMFDMDYPGHFMRRIKDVSLTIPSVSGPYNGVHCRLTLLGSSTRMDPLLSLSPAQCCNKCKSGNGYDACPHDPRIVRQYAATEAIATSSGQNDSGLFEMNIHDDRYLPFEYHGAVSKWRIELPPDNNYFDMDTLSDFIVHLNYTAREGGDRLRHAATEAAEKRLPGAGWCLFDVQHDFPDAWELFRSKPEDKRPRHLNLKFGRNLFPFLPGHREVRIDKMALLFDTCERPDCDCCAGECACGEDKTRACWRVGFKNHRGEGEETSISCAASGDWSDLYYGLVDAQMGPLGRNGARQEARFRFPAEVGEICQMFLLCRYEVAPRCPASEDGPRIRVASVSQPGLEKAGSRTERTSA